MSFKLLVALIGLAVTTIPVAIGFLHFRLPRSNQVVVAFAVQTILFFPVYYWLATELAALTPRNDSWGLGRMLVTIFLGALSAIWFINLVTAFKAWSSKRAQKREQ